MAACFIRGSNENNQRKRDRERRREEGGREKEKGKGMRKVIIFYKPVSEGIFITFAASYWE